MAARVSALAGALLIVGGIVALIVAGDRRPRLAPGSDLFGRPISIPAGWSRTAYDLVRIGGWALIVFGAVTVVFAVVREIKRTA